MQMFIIDKENNFLVVTDAEFIPRVGDGVSVADYVGTDPDYGDDVYQEKSYVVDEVSFGIENRKDGTVRSNVYVTVKECQ